MKGIYFPKRFIYLFERQRFKDIGVEWRGESLSICLFTAQRTRRRPSGAARSRKWAASAQSPTWWQGCDAQVIVLCLPGDIEAALEVSKPKCGVHMRCQHCRQWVNLLCLNTRKTAHLERGSAYHGFPFPGPFPCLFPLSLDHFKEHFTSNIYNSGFCTHLYLDSLG